MVMVVVVVVVVVVVGSNSILGVALLGLPRWRLLRRSYPYLSCRCKSEQQRLKSGKKKPRREGKDPSNAGIWKRRGSSHFLAAAEDSAWIFLLSRDFIPVWKGANDFSQPLSERSILPQKNTDNFTSENSIDYKLNQEREEVYGEKPFNLFKFYWMIP